MLPVGYTNQDRLRDYASLFSRNQVLSWGENDFSSIDAKIIRYDSQILNRNNWTYLKYLKKIYKRIEQYYQNEYVLKNSFLNQWLANESGEKHSVIFNEYRVGHSIADLVMFNGTSKAFEIKTVFDTNARLSNQLEDYRKAFNEVYIIVPESKLDLYKKVKNDIGLITFTKDTEKKFSLIRNAARRLAIDSKVIMNILHTKEYKAIIKTYFGSLPDMTSFKQYEICSKLISKIPLEILNDLYLKMMKSRRTPNHLSLKSHKEFNQLSIALNLSKHQYKKLMLNLKQTINIE